MKYVPTCFLVVIPAVSVHPSSRRLGFEAAEGPRRTDSPAERCFHDAFAGPGGALVSLSGLKTQ